MNLQAQFVMSVQVFESDITALVEFAIDANAVGNLPFPVV